jgi:hypothetical protein
MLIPERLVMSCKFFTQTEIMGFSPLVDVCVHFYCVVLCWSETLVFG